MNFGITDPRLPAARVEIYDAGGWDPTPDGPRKIERTLLRATGDNQTGNRAVDTAFDNATRVAEWFTGSLRRDSWDGSGSPFRVDLGLHGSLKWRDGKPTNEIVNHGASASWVTESAFFSAGIGGRTAGIERPEFALGSGSLDLVAHEFVHGMTHAATAKRDPIQPATPQAKREYNAVMEAISDVIAVTIDPDDWKIAEDSFTPSIPGDAARELDKPRFPTIASLRAAEDSGEEADIYERSSPLSYGAVVAAQALGPEGRTIVRDIWTKAVTDHLRKNDSYEQWARHTTRAASELYGHSSAAAKSVRSAWRQIGLL